MSAMKFQDVIIENFFRKNLSLPVYAEPYGYCIRLERRDGPHIMGGMLVHLDGDKLESVLLDLKAIAEYEGVELKISHFPS